MKLDQKADWYEQPIAIGPGSHFTGTGTARSTPYATVRFGQ
jgi:hypothetical protein